MSICQHGFALAAGQSGSHKSFHGGRKSEGRRDTAGRGAAWAPRWVPREGAGVTCGLTWAHPCRLTCGLTRAHTWARLWAHLCTHLPPNLRAHLWAHLQTHLWAHLCTYIQVPASSPVGTCGPGWRPVGWLHTPGSFPRAMWCPSCTYSYIFLSHSQKVVEKCLFSSSEQ